MRATPFQTLVYLMTLSALCHKYLLQSMRLRQSLNAACMRVASSRVAASCPSMQGAARSSTQQVQSPLVIAWLLAANILERGHALERRDGPEARLGQPAEWPQADSAASEQRGSALPAQVRAHCMYKLCFVELFVTLSVLLCICMLLCNAIRCARSDCLTADPSHLADTCSHLPPSVPWLHVAHAPQFAADATLWCVCVCVSCFSDVLPEAPSGPSVPGRRGVCAFDVVLGGKLKLWSS